ncbi:protein TolR [Sandaracinobacteroides saxicola]|uniref:Protein TolR n=1 Tax=Sandaracinobacteroides saxicola TaxID=2759707 RepID=A0A7G5IJE8_9SPHN|nr:protein TolR [Sandaracinobacteroides saxicola]QMW23490.1 protein TolR [Sandaracinobacteroides saxicola]
MAEINVTPMVDVMLVLLIIFMVAAPLLVTGVPVDLPKTAAKSLNADSKPISISVDRQGAIFIDQQPQSAAQLPAKLAALRAARSDDARVFVRADTAVPYGQVATVLAQVTGAGFTKVALVNQPLAAP